MAYNDKIQETEQEIVAELYEFRIGQTVNYYTSYKKNVLYASNIYKSRTIKRTNLKRHKKLRSVKLTVSAQLDLLGLKYIANAPVERVFVKITRVFIDGSGDSIIFFEGEVVSITIKDFIAIAEVESSMTIVRNKLPQEVYQPRCNWMLFEDRCGLLEIDYQVDATVTLDGADLVSSTFATKPGGWFTGGFVEKIGDFRWITNHVGERITLQVPFDSRVYDGATVAAFPGCDGSYATCRDKFANLAKRLAFDNIPSSNPIIWGLKKS